jgi:methionyl-tRNA synthetase
MHQHYIAKSFLCQISWTAASEYDPDPLRFYLTAPETRNTEFSWEDFVERNNNELVATWGRCAWPTGC